MNTKLTTPLRRRPTKGSTMGMTRKIASIASLGVVSFRSDAEQLDRSEFRAGLAASKVEDLAAELEKKDQKLSRAQKKQEKAELGALAEAKKAKREKRRSSKSADSKVVSGADAAIVAGRRAKRKARKATKKVAKQAAKRVADVTDADIGS